MAGAGIRTACRHCGVSLQPVELPMVRPFAVDRRLFKQKKGVDIPLSISVSANCFYSTLLKILSSLVTVVS